jgi:hypothetical protein
VFVLIVSAIKTVESRSQLRVDTPCTQSESKLPDRYYRRVRVGLKSKKKTPALATMKRVHPSASYLAAYASSIDAKINHCLQGSNATIFLYLLCSPSTAESRE